MDTSVIPECLPVACSEPSFKTVPELNWNISYNIFYGTVQSLATTTFKLMCTTDFHFVNKNSNFTAICGWDG
jgi:hypothetical protein